MHKYAAELALVALAISIAVICCVIMYSKFYIYFMRVCYNVDISINMLILACAQKLA